MSMNAAVVRRYGPPSQAKIERVALPRAGRGEAVVAVAATSVNSGDARIRGAHFPAGYAVPARLILGIRGPRHRVLGTAMAGRVGELGSGAAGLRIGQRVCGMTGMALGAHAEHVALSADRLAPIPDAVSDDDAAAVLFGGTTALWFLRDRARVRRGERVLVLGGSGAVGTHAVQIARALGAKVTATTSGPHTDLVAGLGAHEVIDYTQTAVHTLHRQWDVVFDTVGAYATRVARGLVAPGGRLLLAAPSLGESVRARGAVIAGTAGSDRALVSDLLAWVADRTITPVIDTSLPLARIDEAHARVDSGRKVGTLLIHPHAR